MGNPRYQKDGRDMFVRKEVQLTNGKETVFFDYKYVVAKRQSVLEFALDRVRMTFDEEATRKHMEENNLRECEPFMVAVPESQIKAFVKQVGREVGYITMAREGEESACEDLSVVEIPLDDLKNLFKKSIDNKENDAKVEA